MVVFTNPHAELLIIIKFSSVIVYKLQVLTCEFWISYIYCINNMLFWTKCKYIALNITLYWKF